MTPTGEPHVDGPGRPTRPWTKKRVIGELDSGRDGPLLICTAGIHGNEPAGGDALTRIFADPSVASLQRGRLVGFAGNLSALAADRRFLDRDLNRIWLHDVTTRLRTNPTSARDAEEAELAGLLPFIDREIAAAKGPVYLVDLHTTSGPGRPFACCMELGDDRAFIECLRIPVVHGLRPRMTGTLMDHVAGRGHSAVGVEGGSHRDPGSIDRLEAVVRVVMDAIGMHGDVSDGTVEDGRRLLVESAAGCDRFVEVFHRHETSVGDGFVMEPGYENFSRVAVGEIVARDASGPIRAPEDGIMLFPRYQDEGEDGYFLARAVEL